MEGCTQKREAQQGLWRGGGYKGARDGGGKRSRSADDAYSRALAECDTCENFGCPRGDSEPASWTITVLQFDESSEDTSWFSLTASRAPSPIPQLPPAAIDAAMPLPAPRHVAAIALPTTSLQSNLIDNIDLVTNISSLAYSVAKVDATKDPWAHAHTRVCAHANQECSACSISLTCCSCRALRYTPGPPPSSPPPPAPTSAPTNRS